MQNFTSISTKTAIRARSGGTSSHIRGAQTAKQQLQAHEASNGGKAGRLARRIFKLQIRSIWDANCWNNTTKCCKQLQAAAGYLCEQQISNYTIKERRAFCIKVHLYSYTVCVYVCVWERPRQSRIPQQQQHARCIKERVLSRLFIDLRSDNNCATRPLYANQTVRRVKPLRAHLDIWMNRPMNGTRQELNQSEWLCARCSRALASLWNNCSRAEARFLTALSTEGIGKMHLRGC